MRLPNTAHTSRPWRIHELTRDFRLEDVWALPTPGGPDDFPRLVEAIAVGRPVAAVLPRRPRALRDPVEARGAARLGRPGRRPRLQGADAPRPAAGGSARRPVRPGLRRAPLHLALPARRRVGGGDRQPDHARRHAPRLGPGRAGGYRGQMAVYVKPNGRLGTAYMAAIRPFRHLIVYPPMMRQIGRDWRARSPQTTRR